MRRSLSLLCLIAVACLMIDARLVSAQKSSSTGKGKSTSSEKPPEAPTEIAGKSLEEWIKLIASRDRSKSEKAIQTVQGFGPRSYEAVPALLAELEKHTVSLPVDISIRVNATMALGNIFSSFDDLQPKHVERAVKVLSRLLSDGQAIVKGQAALALGKMGPLAAGAIPVLLKTLGDRGTWETRQAAAVALGSVGIDPSGKKGPAPEVIGALGKALTDPASAVRMAAMQSLTNLGSQSVPAHRKQLIQFLNPLTDRKKEPEPGIRILAHMAVMHLSDEISESRLGIIAGMLESREYDPPTRAQAAQALGRVGPKARSSIPILVGGLKDSYPEVAMTCLWALGRMEDSAKGAIPALQAVMADPKSPDPMKKAAALVIDTILGKNKEKTKSTKTAPVR